MTTHLIADRYTIDQKIGSGGMGNVFRGIDQQTQTAVAIKVLKPEQASPEIITRFIREGEALRQLNHPNIVTLLNAVQENDQHYLIMELVEGGALDDILEQTPRLPIKQILNIALDLSDALTRAHRLNIIHRDIKPANVLLASDGMPRLSDFGIAYTSDSHITETGAIVGTIAYIAPEVLQGERADARSDIWSLGIMLFEMLAGEHPFKSTANPGALVFAIVSQPLPDLETLRPDAPAALIDLIQRMVMKNPSERIPRMRLVGAELEALLSGESFGASDTTSQITVISSEEGSRFASSSSRTATVIRNNLPLQTTPFVGRESELKALEGLIRDPSVRLLTILASGGMGKTRLSLELAGTCLRPAQGDTLFEEGIYFVDLAPLTSAENILQTVGEAVGYIFQKDSRAPNQQLYDYLREKHILILMDNFEHVIAGHTLVQEILQAAPHVKILATSREKLNLSAESVFVLEGMGVPDWETPADALEYGAVKLFMQSAQRVRSDFQLQAEDLKAVARICRLVLGVPLGIVLAAAWLDSLSLNEIVDEISRGLDFLETDMRDLPQRQRSLRAVFEYSWALLSEQDRWLFAQCSVFRGGFTREAAQQITGATLRALTGMINKSLLRRDNASGRYEIHELLRQYAEEKLLASPDPTSIYKAHSQYYLGLLPQLAPKIKGGSQLEALTFLETDFENIRCAWMWAVRHKIADHLQPAIEGLYLFLSIRNRFMDGEPLFSAARQAWPATGDHPALVAGQVLVRYPPQPPIAAFERGLAIAEAHHDAFETAFCRRLVGHNVSHAQFKPEGIAMLEASLHEFEALGATYYVAQVLDDMGWSYRLEASQAAQERVVMRSLELRRGMDDKIGIANSLRNMGGAMGGFFDPTGQSLRYWQEAKTICYEMNDRLGVAWNAALQGSNLIFQGHFDQVEEKLDEAYPYAVEMNDPVVKGFIQVSRGTLFALRDEDYDRGQKLVDEGFPPGTSPDFRLITMSFATTILCCGQSRFERFWNYLPLFKRIPFNQTDYVVPIYMPNYLVSLASEKHFMRATELMSAYSKNTVSYTGQPFPIGWFTKWALVKRLRAQFETELGQPAFQAAWTRGMEISLKEMTDEVQTFLATGGQRS